MKKNIFYTLCLLFLVGNLYSQQTVWVKAGGTGDGSSEATAYGSFTTAFGQIDSAGDVLRVVGNVPASGQSLNKNFAYTIEGDAGGSTLTGTAGATRMFTNNAAGTGSQNVTFKNIKFTGATGSTGTGGGGVLYSNIANTINFENCRFEGNSLVSTVTTGGGALFITLTTVTITDCLFKENTALSKGGAISLATGANVTLTRCTFYKNSTTSATGNLNAAALWVVAGAVVNGYNCTFFQNTTGATNQDYGVIRSDGGTTNVSNSLFYDNKLNTNVAAAGDWGSLASIGSTLTKSLAQKISANVTNTNSTVNTTGVVSSGLAYDDTSGKVKFKVAPSGDATPIAFGSDGKDVGAWNCGTRVTPTFTQVAAICSGATLSALPTTSNNGITGTWSPALDNTTTTTYTFLPGLGQCALSTTMTITVNPSTTTGSVIVSQNTPYTWAENNVTYTQTTTTSITTGCNTATLNFTLLGASAPTISTLTSNGTTVITQGCGGSTLIITGTDFSGASVVTVNGVAVASFTVNSSTQITAILSPGPVSSGAVAVTTPAGTGTSAGNFAVNAQVTPTFTQVAAICPGESLSALPTTSNNSITGTWSPALNNAATTTYTFTPTAGQCATTATMTITVNSGVTPTFTQVATICLGASLSALPTTSNNSITGTWSPALNNAATTVYTFTPDAGQCASTATMTITVNASCTKTFTWNGSASNDWATAANWTTTGDGPDTFPGQTKTTDIVVISNGGTPVIASGTYGIISLAINNASGATTGSILTINSGATLTVNNTAVVAITLKGGSIVNNGTLNATSTNVGASFGIACQVPSVAPSSATEYGYSGSGALNINTSASTNASSGGIQFSGTAANTTYKMLFNGATTFSLNNTALAVYALRVGDGAKGPVVIGGAGFTLGTVGVPVNCGLLSMGKDGNNVTVNTGTTLTLNSKSTNTAMGINILQTTAASADDTFTNKGTITINGVSTAKGINLNIDNASQAAGTNKISFENQGTINVALAVGGTNFGAFAVLGTGSNDGLVTITNSGTMNLSNTQPFTSSSGRPFTVATAASSPTVIFNNSGVLTLSGESTNFGGQLARSTINNTGTITSNTDFQQFTIANTSTGTISFVPSGNRQVTFTTSTAVTAAVGDTYTDASSNVFTVRTAASAGTTLVTTVPMTAITASTGTLTKILGSGTETIAYTATALTAGNAIGTTSSASNSGRINTGTGSVLYALTGLTTTTSTSVIAPGGDSGKGSVNLAGTALTINGTLKMQVAGNTTAGVNYDQINNTTSLGSFNISLATLDIAELYTPAGAVTLDIVKANTTVGSEGTITGTFASITGLAGTRWAVNYISGVANTTAGKVQLVYTPLPTITSLTSNGTETISQGCSGSTLIITGTNFTGASAVTVNGVAVASYAVDSSTQITAVLPSSATSGVVVVTISGETATSAGNFSVIATVTPNFTPVAAICYQGSLSALPETSTNGVTGTWSPALNNEATTEYTFTPDEDQCAASTAITMTIVVNALPELPAVACNENVVWNPATCQYVITKIISAGTDGTLTVCAGTIPSESQLFSALTGEDAGGSWSNEGLVYTYTVVATAPCTGTDTATVTVTEQSAPNAGTNGTLSLSTSPSEAALFASITGEDAGGTWTSPPSGFVGTYTYTVIATAPCTGSDTSTVTVTSASVIPTSPLNLCKGATVASVTGTTSLKFYKDNVTTTQLGSTTKFVTATTYYVTETNSGNESSRVPVTITVNNLPATPSALTSTESGLICKYINSSTPVTFTATATGAISSYIWTVPTGASFITGATAVQANPTTGTGTSSSIGLSFEEVSPIPGGIGSVTVKSVDANGCVSLPKALALTTKVPTAPTALVMTSLDATTHFEGTLIAANPTAVPPTPAVKGPVGLNSLAKITKVGPYIGTATEFILTAPVAPSAYSYRWSLPYGVSLVSASTNTNVISAAIINAKILDSGAAQTVAATATTSGGVTTYTDATVTSTNPVIVVKFNTVPAGAGKLNINVYSVGGCGDSTARLLALDRALPSAPKALVLTSGNTTPRITGITTPANLTAVPPTPAVFGLVGLSTLAKITSVGPYTSGTGVQFTLTATPIVVQGATATSYAWVLPTGVHTANGTETTVSVSTTVEGVTTVTTGVVAVKTTDPSITVDFDQASGTGNLVLSVYAINGTGQSVAAKALTLTRVLPTAPAKLVLTDGSTTVVAKAGVYAGKETSLTLTATPITKQGAEATSYSWVLPAGVNVTAGATNLTTPVTDGSGNKTWTSTGTVLTVDLEGITTATTVPMNVYAVNGAGTSLPKALTSVATALPLPVAAVAGSLSVCNKSEGYNYTITAPVGANKYSITAPAGSVITSASSPSNVTNALITTDLTFNVVYSGTSAFSTLDKKLNITAGNVIGFLPTAKAFTLTKLATCPLGRESADEFKVSAYPNPSSSEFTIQASRKGATVKVYDMMGRLIENRQATSNTVQVGSRLAAGAYNVIVKQGANTKTLKVIKK